MKNDISVIVSLGPGTYDSETDRMSKYATIGVKWNPELLHRDEFLDDMILKIKDEFVKKALRLHRDDVDAYDVNNIEDKFKKFKDMESGLIILTDAFFEYLKNTETKIEAIRVSLDDYKDDWLEHKISTLKTPMVVLTADTESLNDMFSSLVKELYYDYGDKVIDIYSIILTPKQYKMVNNIPIEYRGLLVRVKK